MEKRGTFSEDILLKYLAVVYIARCLILIVIFQSDVAPLQAVHGRQLPQHRRPEPHQLQHALRLEDANDDLSRNGATRFHGLALDHCKLDAQTM